MAPKVASLPLQCGRRGDSLKLALGWIYHGKEGYSKLIENAFHMSAYLAYLVDEHPDLYLASENPPPCLQVCFYYAPGGKPSHKLEENSQVTERTAERLVQRGYMVDFADGDHGAFFRVVVGRETRQSTLEGLVKAVVEEGRGA